MGRRKGSKNKKKRTTSGTSTRNKNTFLNEFIGGLIAVLGLALIVVFKFDDMGVVCTAINQIFTGLLGEARLLLIIVCIYVGVLAIANEKKVNIWTELLKGFVITVLVSSLVYVFSETRYDLWTNPAGFVNYAYNGAVLGINKAGILGGIIASITYLTGEIVSKIILVTFNLISQKQDQLPHQQLLL